jgi:transcriptional regulator with XRE-family HTH domain
VVQLLYFWVVIVNLILQIYDAYSSKANTKVKIKNTFVLFLRQFANILMHLPENIKYLMAVRGWNNSDLGRELNISAQQAGRYVNSKNEPKLETLLKLARLFDVNLDDLILKDLSKETGRPFGAEGEDRATEDETLTRMNKLLEQRVATLEREILRDNPGLAKELGIE